MPFCCRRIDLVEGSFPPTEKGIPWMRVCHDVTAVFDDPNLVSPSTLGTFLRSFTFGHVRQLDAVASRLLINLAAQAPLLRQTYRYAKQGAGRGYTGVEGPRRPAGDRLHAVLRPGSTSKRALPPPLRGASGPPAAWLVCAAMDATGDSRHSPPTVA